MDRACLVDRLKKKVNSNINYLFWASFTLVTAVAYLVRSESFISLSNIILLAKVNLAQYTVYMSSSLQIFTENLMNSIQPFFSTWNVTFYSYLANFCGQAQNLGLSSYGHFHQLSEKILIVPLGISVIIPALNEERYIERCLKSLNNQTYKGHYEIIVVDGCSRDRTAEIAEKWADKVVVKPGPAGFARNEGARAAKDDIYAFLDADTIASPHWLEKMDESFRANYYVPCVTGPTYPYEGDRWDYVAYLIVTQWLSRVSAKVGLPHVPGFNCAYRKEPFWKVGGFDEKRKLSEDIILSTNIRKEGRVKYNKEMVAYTSLRRVRKYGYPYLTTFYVINGIIAITFKETMPGYSVIR